MDTFKILLSEPFRSALSSRPAVAVKTGSQTTGILYEEFSKKDSVSSRIDWCVISPIFADAISGQSSLASFKVCLKSSEDGSSIPETFFSD